MEKLLDERTSDALLITDMHDCTLALALKTNAGWRITSGLLNNKGRLLQTQFLCPVSGHAGQPGISGCGLLRNTMAGGSSARSARCPR
ncbi:MAG: hypothetical protein M0C28_47340 [Candidatus Moduliflexus flocculans]|nr:hypothetical protein [Candidatus Moduliflexus flocculans]